MGRASFAVLLIAVTRRATASFATLFIRFHLIVLLRLRVEFQIGQVIAPRSVLCVVRGICPALLAHAFGAIIAILSKIAQRCPVCLTLLRALALIVLAFVVSSATLAAIVFRWIRFRHV